MTDQTCRCGRPTRDGAYVCEKCLDSLAKVLNEMQWTEDQIATSITRQRSASGSGSRSATTPLPWDEKASDAERALRTSLATWVRFCVEERVRNSDPRPGLPKDRLAAMARWLLWRVDGLAFHELGSDAVDEITDAVAEVERRIFSKPRPKMYLGICTAERDGETCGHSIYAKEGDVLGKCAAADCRAPYKVAESRQSLEDALDSRLVTAAEVATIAVHLGLEQPRERVRKRVNQWAARKQLTAKGVDGDGNPRFLYSEVRGLLYTAFGEREHAG